MNVTVSRSVMNNSLISSTSNITQQEYLCGVKSPTNILNPIILLQQEKKRRAKLPKFSPMIESLGSQARTRSISGFNPATKRLQLLSMEILAKGTYKDLQSHQWILFQVDIDTIELPPER